MDLRTKFKVLVLGSSTLIMIMANTMLFPIFPQMRKALDVGLTDISLLVLIVALPAALFSPVGGIMADFWGRKRIMIPSILLYGVAGGLIGLAIFVIENPFNSILFLRLLQGIGSASPMYLAMALAGDIFQSKDRTTVMGFLETANGLGKVFSPIVGGALGTIAWYAPFFLYPVVSIPIAIAFWVVIKEPPIKEKVTIRSELGSCGKLLNVSHGLALFAGLLAIMALYGAMFWLGEFMDQRIPEGTLIHGLVIAIPVAALVLTALLAGLVVGHLGPRLTLTVGLLLMGTATALIPVTFKSVLLWPVIVFLGIGAGLLLPVLDTIATAVSSRGHRGIITTIFGGFRCLGAAAAPFLIAVLLKISILLAFLPIAALGIGLGLAVFFLSKDDRLIPPELR